jgi:hypothetical protein
LYTLQMPAFDAETEDLLRIRASIRAYEVKQESKSPSLSLSLSRLGKSIRAIFLSLCVKGISRKGGDRSGRESDKDKTPCFSHRFRGDLLRRRRREGKGRTGQYEGGGEWRLVLTVDVVTDDARISETFLENNSKITTSRGGDLTFREI